MPRFVTHVCRGCLCFWVNACKDDCLDNGVTLYATSAFTLLVEWRAECPACKKRKFAPTVLKIYTRYFRATQPNLCWYLNGSIQQKLRKIVVLVGGGGWGGGQGAAPPTAVKGHMLPLEIEHVHQFGNFCLDIYPISSCRLVVNTTHFPHAVVYLVT